MVWVFFPFLYIKSFLFLNSQKSKVIILLDTEVVICKCKTGQQSLLFSNLKSSLAYVEYQCSAPSTTYRGLMPPPRRCLCQSLSLFTLGISSSWDVNKSQQMWLSILRERSSRISLLCHEIICSWTQINT